MEKRKKQLIEFRKNEMNYYQYDWYYIPNTNNSLIINREGTIVETNNFKLLRVYLHKNYKKIFHQGEYRDYDKLLAETFIPHPIHKFKLIHLDGNTLNNQIDNLRWVNPNKQYNIIENENFKINTSI
jgi:hypothetical protein